MNVGDKAPEVLGVNEKGERILLSNYRGKKVVLYFYPKDNTSGCTAEACSLRDNYSALKSKGYEVIGVSVDSADSHKKFIDGDCANIVSLFCCTILNGGTKREKHWKKK